MANIMFMRKGEVHTAPVGGIPLSDLIEGQIVMINENGSPVPFYLACHDYESGLNGEGRILLVRQNAYTNMAYQDSGYNYYISSDIDAWFNGTYKAMLDEAVQEAIATTTIYYTANYGPGSVETTSKSIFALSMAELNLTHTYAWEEGSALPIYDTLQVATDDSDTKVAHWTRTPNYSGGSYAFQVTTSGSASSTAITNTATYVRPCFTLPSDTLFAVNSDGTVTAKV